MEFLERHLKARAWWAKAHPKVCFNPGFTIFAYLAVMKGGATITDVVQQGFASDRHTRETLKHMRDDNLIASQTGDDRRVTHVSVTAQAFDGFEKNTGKRSRY